MMIVKLKIIDCEFYNTRFPLKISEDLIPAYATAQSAGLDLRTTKDFILTADQQMLIPTGIAIHIDNPDVCAVIAPRSGLGHKQGIILGNTIGIIDSDYQNEIMLSMWNRGHETRYFSRGDRVAQLIFMPIIRAQFRFVEEFEPSERGLGGFGSTGT